MDVHIRVPSQVSISSSDRNLNSGVLWSVDICVREEKTDGNIQQTNLFLSVPSFPGKEVGTSPFPRRNRCLSRGVDPFLRREVSERTFFFGSLTELYCEKGKRVTSADDFAKKKRTSGRLTFFEG
ncbi:hypothetical protein TNCV_3105061 [Trichonephila clavipes]|nr:hypothetical protein TNCV_3105061 [Trichonephila clavipes]